MFYPLIGTFRCIPLCRWRASTGVMALGIGENGDRLHLRGGRMRSARARLQDAKMMSFVLSGGGRRVDPPTHSSELPRSSQSSTTHKEGRAGGFYRAKDARQACFLLGSSTRPPPPQPHPPPSSYHKTTRRPMARLPPPQPLAALYHPQPPPPLRCWMPARHTPPTLFLRLLRLVPFVHQRREGQEEEVTGRLAAPGCWLPLSLSLSLTEGVPAGRTDGQTGWGGA